MDPEWAQDGAMLGSKIVSCSPKTHLKPIESDMRKRIILDDSDVPSDEDSQPQEKDIFDEDFQLQDDTTACEHVLFDEDSQLQGDDY